MPKITRRQTLVSMLGAPLVGRSLLTPEDALAAPAQTQNICYFPFLESGPCGDTSITVIGGFPSASVTVELFHPDGRRKARETLLKDGREVTTNLQGEFTFQIEPNAVCHIRLPGDPRTPVRCWVCIRTDNQSVKSFASIPVCVGETISWLFYPWCVTKRAFSIPFASTCPVRDQVCYIANTTGSNGSFFLVPYTEKGERIDVRTLTIGAHNCLRISLAEQFPLLFLGGFLGWFFFQLSFDGVLKCLGEGTDDRFFPIPVA